MIPIYISGVKEKTKHCKLIFVVCFWNTWPILGKYHQNKLGWVWPNFSWTFWQGNFFFSLLIFARFGLNFISNLCLYNHQSVNQFVVKKKNVVNLSHTLSSLLVMTFWISRLTRVATLCTRTIIMLGTQHFTIIPTTLAYMKLHDWWLQLKLFQSDCSSITNHAVLPTARRVWLILWWNIVSIALLCTENNTG